MDAPAIIKPTGSEQRLDVELSEAIAYSLGEMVLAGKAIFPNRGLTGLKLTIVENGEEKAIQLGKGAIHNWLTRLNVIPGLNVPLKAYLDGKREEKRLNDERTRQASIIENAEKLIEGIVKKDVVEEKEIYRVDGDVRTLTRVERIKNGSRTIEARVKAAVFGLERLNPGRYSQKVDIRAMVAVFPLSEIRKAREEIVREAREQHA